MASLNPMWPLVKIYQDALLYNRWPDFSALRAPGSRGRRAIHPLVHTLPESGPRVSGCLMRPVVLNVREVGKCYTKNRSNVERFLTWLVVSVRSRQPNIGL